MLPYVIGIGVAAIGLGYLTTKWRDSSTNSNGANAKEASGPRKLLSESPPSRAVNEVPPSVKEAAKHMRKFSTLARRFKCM
eukprot:1141927-Prorocentrum_minimum.AAC.2